MIGEFYSVTVVVHHGLWEMLRLMRLLSFISNTGVDLRLFKFKASLKIKKHYTLALFHFLLLKSRVIPSIPITPQS